MPNAIVTAEELSKLPDALKSEYEPIQDGDRKGSYMLKVGEVDGFRLENVTGLKTTVATLRAERKKIEDQFEAYKPFGSVDELRQQLEELKAMKAAGNSSDALKVQIEAVKSQLTEKASKERAELQKALGDKDLAITNILVQRDAIEAITAEKGNVKLLMPHVINSMRVIWDNGKPRAVIVGPDGNPRITDRPNSTEEMTVREYVALMKKSPDFKSAFSGEGMGGSGGQPPRSSGTQVTGSFRDALRNERRILDRK